MQCTVGCIAKPDRAQRWLGNPIPHLPYIHRMSKSRISWNTFAHQMENIQRQFHKMIYKWLAVSTQLYRYDVKLLLSLLSLRNCHQHCWCWLWWCCCLIPIRLVGRWWCWVHRIREVEMSFEWWAWKEKEKNVSWEMVHFIWNSLRRQPVTRQPSRKLPIYDSYQRLNH